jgi:hypothetical protein
MKRHALFARALFLLLAGCSGGGAVPPGSPVDAAAGTDVNGDGRDAGALFGNVTVRLFDDPDPASAYSTVQASFFDGPMPVPNPALGPLVASQTQGDCQLLVPKAVTCAPTCMGGVCTDNNHCAPDPAHQTAGVIHVQGLAGMDIALEPMGPNLAYSGAPTLPFKPCAEGTLVQATGAAFALAGACIAPLTLTGPTTLPVVSGQPVTITWTPPGRAGISRVQLALEIAHHGGYRGEIDCEVADSGSFVIPASLVTALINLGRAGYPKLQVVRLSSAAASAQPGVRFSMQSFVERDVDTGVVSCMTTDECPAGTTCQGNRTCQ